MADSVGPASLGKPRGPGIASFLRLWFGLLASEAPVTPSGAVLWSPRRRARACLSLCPHIFPVRQPSRLSSRTPGALCSASSGGLQPLPPESRQTRGGCGLAVGSHP